MLLRVGSNCRLRAEREASVSLFGLASGLWNHHSFIDGSGFPYLGKCCRGGPHSQVIEDMSGDATHPLYSQSSIIARATEADDDVCKRYKNIGLVVPVLLHCHDSLVNGCCRIVASNSSRTFR